MQIMEEMGNFSSRLAAGMAEIEGVCPLWRGRGTEVLCRTPKEWSRPVKKYRLLLQKEQLPKRTGSCFSAAASQYFFTASGRLTGDGQS